MTVVLLGVPWDGSSSGRRGAAQAPAAIRAAWDRVSSWSNPMTESGLDLVAEAALRDGGDVGAGDATAMREAVEAAVAGAVAGGERPLLLGGDHSVTYPALRGARAALGVVDVLHLDAHPDLYPEYEGDRFSHACPLARALEDGLIGRLVQVGIRTVTPPQRAVADRHGVEMVTMANWAGPGVFFFDRPVWISLDLDVLDPAFAPAVSHPEPGGLSVRDVLGTLQRLEGRVIGADLVEYNPALDRDGATGTVCVKLVKELAALLHAQAGPPGRG